MSRHIRQNIEIINDVKFTGREIDLISYIISGKGVKKIANELSISPRTVEAHIYNIKGKIGASSREDIISFVENSDKILLMRYHYFELLKHNNLEFVRSWGDKDIEYIFPNFYHLDPTRDKYIHKFLKNIFNFLNNKRYRLSLFKYGILAIVIDIIFHIIEIFNSIFHFFNFVS